MADRSFTDEELASIIRRAARIHESTPDSRHSLADVQQIAEQVGLPPEIVAAVADDLARRGPENHLLRMLLGPPGRSVASVMVPRRVTPEEYPALLEVIRAQVGAPGHASQIGNTLEWRLAEIRSDSVGSMTITITPKADTAKVCVAIDLQPMRLRSHAAGMFVSAVVAFIASVEAGLTPLMVAGITLGATSLGWALGRAGWRQLARPAEARTDRLCQTIASHLAVVRTQ